MSAVRSEPRYGAELPVVVSIDRKSAEFVTANVSFEGLFVETPPHLKSADGASRGALTDLALKVKGLVRLTLLLPDGPPLEASAVVVHVATRKRYEGAGLKFFGLAGPARTRWERFLASQRDKAPGSFMRPVPLPRGEHFEPTLYRSQHHVAVLRVYVAGVADLYRLADPTHDSVFVSTDERLRVGDEVGLQLVHPDSDHIFELSAFARRLVDQHGVRGADFELFDLDDERRKRLVDFIDDGLEALFDEETFEPTSDER